MLARNSKTEAQGEAPLGALGAGSDFSPFFDYAGIPSVDVGFGGDYGVYHSLYDDFYWMKHFGDPTFSYHAALARILGTIALRLDEADVLPFDYATYASEINRMQAELLSRASQQAGEAASLKAVADASGQLSASASRAAISIRTLGSAPVDPEKIRELNHALVSVEQGLLTEGGLAGRPWFKHTVYAPGSYAGYAAEVMPGVSESLDRKDAGTLRTEADSLAAALRRAAARLDTVARLAQQAGSASSAGH
jgi:N-acetylated-alpha-linked acidic dipeptidase